MFACLLAQTHVTQVHIRSCTFFSLNVEYVSIFFFKINQCFDVLTCALKK
jgi:hypothetical protein